MDGTLMDGGGDSSSESDVEMEAANGNSAPALVPPRNEPIIDDEGFQLVQSRRPGRKR